MTLGEIKIEALKMMALNGENDIFEQDVTRLAVDDAYREYLLNMTGAINRCFSRLETLRVLPTKVREIVPTEFSTETGRARFSLLSIEDLFEVKGISVERESGKITDNCEFIRIGDTVILDGISEGDRIWLLYRPALRRVSSITEASYVPEIPEDMAELIPYYIKGDLFRTDEPDEAQEAMSWFEQRIAECARNENGNQTSVRPVYDFMAF